MKRFVNGSIRITKVPDGEVPVEIRNYWVGLVLPVVEITDEISGVPMYVVLQSVALEALSQKSPTTLTWWESNGFPRAEECFGFKVSDAEVVENLEELPCRQFLGLLEVGVGARDHWINQH